MLKKIVETLSISLCTVTLVVAMSFTAIAKPKNLSKNIKVGDIVYFGKYEQDGNTKDGKEKIEWQVLEKKGGKVLLISKKILAVQPYNKEFKDITWEECSLRKWLNKDFMKNAFSSDERKKIQKSKIKTKDNQVYKTEGGEDTVDKVFLLSIDEEYKYFNTGEERKAEITNYGIRRLAKVLKRKEENIKKEYFSKDNNWRYWLRSPGYIQGFAAYVNSDGSVSEYGDIVYLANVGFRPAMWVNPN